MKRVKNTVQCIQQTFIDDLLGVRPCARPWGRSDEGMQPRVQGVCRVGGGQANTGVQTDPVQVCGGCGGRGQTKVCGAQWRDRDEDMKETRQQRPCKVLREAEKGLGVRGGQRSDGETGT